MMHKAFKRAWPHELRQKLLTRFKVEKDRSTEAEVDGIDEIREESFSISGMESFSFVENKKFKIW